MPRIMTRARHVRIISNAELDAYEAIEKERVDLSARYEIAVGLGNQLAIRRAKDAINDHDLRHGTRLLDDLTAA